MVVAKEELGRSLCLSQWNWCNDSASLQKAICYKAFCTKSATCLEYLSLELLYVGPRQYSCTVSAVRMVPWKCQLYHTVPGNCHLKALCFCAFTLIKVFLPFLIKQCSATHAHPCRVPVSCTLLTKDCKMKAVPAVYSVTFSNFFFFLLLLPEKESSAGLQFDIWITQLL